MFELGIYGLIIVKVWQSGAFFRAKAGVCVKGGACVSHNQDPLVSCEAVEEILL